MDDGTRSSIKPTKIRKCLGSYYTEKPIRYDAIWDSRRYYSLSYIFLPFAWIIYLLWRKMLKGSAMKL